MFNIKRFDCTGHSISQNQPVYIQFSCTCCHRGQGGDGNSFPVIYRERGSTDKENSRNNVWPYFLFRIDDSVLAVTVYLPPLDGGRVDRVLRLYGGRL